MRGTIKVNLDFMSEIPKTIADEKYNRLRNDQGISTAGDGKQFVGAAMLPEIDKLLSKARVSSRRGMGYKIFRSAGVWGKDDKVTSYVACIEGQGEKWKVDISILEELSLGDEELISHWPVIVSAGLDKDLLAATLKRDKGDVDYDPDDIETGNFFDTLLAGAQEHLIEGNEELPSLQERVYGYRVIYYVERTLFLVATSPPKLEVTSGYFFDDVHYPVIEASDKEQPQVALIGDTPAELEAMSRLRHAMETEIDDELLQEFREALVILGFVKRSRLRIDR